MLEFTWLVLIVFTERPGRTVIPFPNRLETVRLFVDIELVEILLAVSKLVLKVVVLKKGGIIVNPPAGRPVSKEPSPICLPNIEPVEIVETNICCVESTWKRPVPATSRVTVGAAIPIPTLLLVFIIIAGVTLLKAVGKTRALTPGSNTIEPVVCMRIRSEADEPLNTSNSWRPVPVDCSAITPCVYLCWRPGKAIKLKLLTVPTFKLLVVSVWVSTAIELREVAIISPMLMKPVLEPIAKKSTVRDEI